MKKIAFTIIVVFLLGSVCYAAAKVNWKRLEMGTGPVATGDEIAVRYLTGLPEIDQESPCYSYKVRLAFDENDLVLKRNMIDQKRGRGLKEVELVRMRYSDIKDLLFGYDATYAAQENKLPTAQKLICGNQKLTILMQRMKSPLVIMMEKDGKRISFVITAPNRDALRLYRGLAERAKVKIKTPLAYRGIVKQRAKLDPPPPDGER